MKEEWSGVVSANEVHDRPADQLLVDARASDRFASTTRPFALDALPGNAGGCIANHPFATNCTPAVGSGHNVVRPTEELRSRFVKTLGGHDAKKSVFSCASGVTACFNIAACVHAGLGRPLLYGGSWSEYAGLYEKELTEQIVSKHGVCFKRITTLPNGTRPNDNTTVRVAAAGGVAQSVKVRDIADETLRSKVKTDLLVGESMHATTKSGTTRIDVLPGDPHL